METFLQKKFDLTRLNSTFSFASYYQFLQKRINGTDDVKRPMLQYFASRIEQAGLQDKEIPAKELDNYKELLELIYVSLTNILLDGNKDVWGITAPFMSAFAYGTPSLYDMFVDKETGWLKSGYVSNFNEISITALKNVYQTILHHLYHIAYPSQEGFVYKYLDPATTLYKFFRINFNHDFIDIQYNHSLPELDKQIVSGIVNDEVFIRYMLNTLPLADFVFKGFGVLTIADITMQQSLAHIKDRLWKLRHDDNRIDIVFEELQIGVRSLLDTNKIDIGAMPFILLNGKLVRNAGEGLLLNEHLEEEDIQAFFKEFEANSQPLIVEDVNDSAAHPELIVNMLKKTTYRTYAAVPIFYQQKVYGILELFSTEPGIITPKRIQLLEGLYVELAQLMKMGHEIFNNSIREVISDRFTVIQPSVAWRFNEAALEYLNQKRIHGKVIQKVPIVFPSVFPFYGAVDIRNSSITRNNAIRADWKLQLHWLQKTATELTVFQLPHVQQLLQHQITFLNSNDADQPISSETISISNSLDNALYQLLKHTMNEQPKTAMIIRNYLQAIDIYSGECSINRRNMEVSMQQTVASIDALLDEMNTKMQQIFPAYYNKFRTDGVEYDLYVGESICPHKKFDAKWVCQLHTIQLEYMRKIALANAAKQQELLTPLLSTQLIFVNSDKIDITFREDEKRFDVEGAYNIHYQMIKKRIDKVHLRNSDERLTQPSKIAIVYMNEIDVADYTTILIEEIKNGKFYNLEYLQLEDLQGVYGLKALRVTVTED